MTYTNTYTLDATDRTITNTITGPRDDTIVTVETTYHKRLKAFTTTATAYDVIDTPEGKILRLVFTHRPAPVPPLSPVRNNVARYSAKALEQFHYENYGSLQSSTLDAALFDWGVSYLHAILSDRTE